MPETTPPGHQAPGSPISPSPLVKECFICGPVESVNTARAKVFPAGWRDRHMPRIISQRPEQENRPGLRPWPAFHEELRALFPGLRAHQLSPQETCRRRSPAPLSVCRSSREPQRTRMLPQKTVEGKPSRDRNHWFVINLPHRPSGGRAAATHGKMMIDRPRAAADATPLRRQDRAVDVGLRPRDGIAQRHSLGEQSADRC